MTPPRVYFYCCPEEDNLQEDVITLAEGLRTLRVPYHASCNYWRESPHDPDSFLLRHDPAVSPDDCDIVVVSYTWPKWTRMRTFEQVRRPLPAALFHPGRRYRTVYLDSHDGHRTVSWEPAFRQFDLILRSKLNRRAWHPANLRPWVLGFQQRILDATDGAPPFAERRPVLLVNFGASHPYPHGTRDQARKYFEPQMARLLPTDATKDDLSREPADPYEALMWRQTGFRFSRTYYERLKQSQAVACFCGDLIPPMPWKRPEQYLIGGGNRARFSRALYEALAKFDSRPRRSVQWDSFRFWEALLAGCAAFNIDLEYYGVALPVMPENWKHYVGIRFDRVSEAVDRLAADPALLGRIAREGRAWALQHYSPRMMASRLLNWCGRPLPGPAGGQ